MKKAIFLGLFLVGCGYHTHTEVINNTTVIVVDDDNDAGETESAPMDAGAPVSVLDAGVPDAGHHCCHHWHHFHDND